VALLEKDAQVPDGHTAQAVEARTGEECRDLTEGPQAAEVTQQQQVSAVQRERQGGHAAHDTDRARSIEIKRWNDRWYPEAAERRLREEQQAAEEETLKRQKVLLWASLDAMQKEVGTLIEKKQTAQQPPDDWLEERCPSCDNAYDLRGCGTPWAYCTRCFECENAGHGCEHTYTKEDLETYIRTGFCPGCGTCMVCHSETDIWCKQALYGGSRVLCEKCMKELGEWQDRESWRRGCERRGPRTGGYPVHYKHQTGSQEPEKVHF